MGQAGIFFSLLAGVSLIGLPAAWGSAKAPFSSTEVFAYESRGENPAADFFESKDFLGNLVRPNYESDETQLLKLYNISSQERTVDEVFCKKVGELTFHIEQGERHLSNIEKFSAFNGAACDIAAADPDEDFRERHLLIFTLHGRTYGLRAVFPKGGNPEAQKELRRFVQSLR